MSTTPHGVRSAGAVSITLLPVAPQQRLPPSAERSSPLDHGSLCHRASCRQCRVLALLPARVLPALCPMPQGLVVLSLKLLRCTHPGAGSSTWWWRGHLDADAPISWIDTACRSCLWGLVSIRRVSH
ncbi:MAG: hypothetical protein LC729_00920, partial [Acidobacteria bacterium]|nr:hypothetical protein [Acidobacteriota bacterium]